MGILDFSDDFQGICNDFHVTCVLKIVGNSDLTLPSAVLNTPLEWRELDPTKGKVLRKGTLFVWSKKLSSMPPLGSVLVDGDGTYWTVWQTVDKQHTETYEARCLNLSITNEPTNVATLLKATYNKAKANEAKATWKGLYSGNETPTDADKVRARFQPSSEQAILEWGADAARLAYRVYFDAPVPPLELAGGEFRIVDTLGNRFRVLRYIEEERIDRLPIAVCDKIVEGREFHQHNQEGP